MLHPPSDDVSETPGIAEVRYPGFGACIICGYDVEVVSHYRGLTIIYHNGRRCFVYPEQRDVPHG